MYQRRLGNLRVYELERNYPANFSSHSIPQENNPKHLIENEENENKTLFL